MSQRVRHRSSQASPSRAPLVTLGPADGYLNQRIYRQLREQISRGNWPPGTRLPGSRILAADLGVSRNTALLAIEQLVADGFADTRARAGVFVARRAVATVATDGPSLAPELPTCFDIGGGGVSIEAAERWGTLRHSLWKANLPYMALPPPGAGERRLREAIASRVCPARGIECCADQVIVTRGMGDALDLMARLTASHGNRILIEQPGDPSLARMARRQGLLPVAMPVGREGASLAKLDRHDAGASLALVSAGAQFPTGARLSARRRGEALAWVRATGGWLIEHDGLAVHSPCPALMVDSRAGDLNVAFVGRLDPSIFGAVGIGFLVLPHHALAAVEPLLADRDLPSRIEQQTLAEYIDRGWFARSVRQIAAAQEDRRRTLVELLEPLRGDLFEDIVADTPHIVATVRGDASAMADHLRSTDAIVRTLAEFAPMTDRNNALLLGYSRFTPDDLRDGAARLTRALAA